MSDEEDWTPREQAMPAVAGVASDAVARHEMRLHAPDLERMRDLEIAIQHTEERIGEAILLAEMWRRSSDQTTRTLGADLLQVLTDGDGYPAPG